MDPETPLTQVVEDDLRVIERELAASPKPADLRQLAEKLAYHKTAGQRTQAVKKYDPRCLYQVGDQILKDYDEHLTVSSKTVEHFQGSVVLTVVHKVANPSFQCEMLEVDYIGGGTFRRYIDYMKKSRAQVFLPANAGAENREPEFISKEDDPRESELPVTDKDLKALERNLRTAMAKSPAFFSWNDHWQLSRNQVDIPEEKIKEAEAWLQETGQPASTEDLIRRLFGLEPSSGVFDLHALSLNFVLDKKHKKDFLFMSPQGWGRWHLKKVLNILPLNLALSAPPAKIPAFQDKGEPLESSLIHSFPMKVYLTWREVLSGGIRIPRSMHKELSHSREYILTEAEEGKSYPVYFFPNHSCLLGLSEYYSLHNIPQGTSLTLERKDLTHLHFWVKKSKKKIAVPRLTYDPQEDAFHDSGEDLFTFALPNKSIFIEREVITGLLALTPQRIDLDLHDLLLKIFKNFSPEPNVFSQHFLRAFHLVDLLRRTSQEDVEGVLLNSSQFVKSEKKKGVFYYKSPELAPPEEEKKKERKPAERPRAPAVWEGEEDERDQLPIGMIEADFLRGEEAEEEGGIQVIEAEAVDLSAAEPAPASAPAPRPAPLPRAPREAPAVPAKKEKAAKKKKLKPEGERATRVRKSEKRVIEEKIAIEESELEALSAIKAAETESAEEPSILPGEPEEEAGEAAAPEISEEAAAPSFGGLFGEKLKSALVKKKPEGKEPEKAKGKARKK